MDLLGIVNREFDPSPWCEGEKIPWNEPGFSARILKEHLNQSHNAASRRFDKIEQQVSWVHQTLLGGDPAHILDLGCGPGLYTSRLAELGHECVGIDYSPASIAYASAFAADLDTKVRRRLAYHLEDVRQAHYGGGYNLIMFIFGEINVFKPEDACLILSKSFHALAPGGLLLLEPQTERAVRQMGLKRPEWYSTRAGVFSDKPHVCLMENRWDAQRRVTLERYFIVDAATGNASCFTSCTQAYTSDELAQLVASSGFETPSIYPSLTGEVDVEQEELYVLVARKPYKS